MPNPKLIGIVCFLFVVVGPLPAADTALVIRSSTGASELLKRIEFAIDGVPTVPNPFDPSAIAVDLEVLPPSGSKLVVPAFWGREFERALENNREVLTPIGEPGWRVRYLPLEAGRHELNVIARIEGQIVARGSTMSDVAPTTSRGLVRVDAGSRYFRFDDGTPLFLNGLCACWHGRRGTYDYDDWLAAYERAGMNYIRIWMWPNAFGIEWDKDHRLQYRLDTAWTLDRVLAEAERRGILVMLCFDYHGMFEVEPDFWKSNNYWPRHPYNAVNGGPCANQDEFFTNPEARVLYQKRLRYMVARWSAFPNVLAWEFFNEIDNVYKYLKHEHVVDWHRDMGAYLRSIDPYRHLITSSFTGGSERPDLFALRQMEFAQYHSYNEKHPAEMTARTTTAFWDRYHKPFFVSEYGTDWKGWKPDTDPHLRALHQAIWGAPFTGAAGTGMTWWWESIHSQDLYRHWSALAKFLEGTAIAASDMRPVLATSKDARVKSWAVATPREALIWVLDPSMNWPEGAMIDNPVPVAGAEVSIEGLEEGDYSVEWWHTLEGRRLMSSEVRVEAGRLDLVVPEFTVDVAARVRRH
jgi:hypothetical protein